MSNCYVNDFSTSVRTYYNDLKRCKPLTRSRERELMELAKKGDESARNDILSANLRFVFLVAKKYRGKGVPTEDLISEGNMGLIKAIEKFDPLKNVKFISYAMWWIHAYMREYIKKRQTMLGIEVSDNETFKPSMSMRSCDNENDDDCTVINNRHAVHERDVDSVEMQYKQEKLIAAMLSRLSEREKDVVERYYGLNGKEEMNLEEIGSLYGITKERARQIKFRAMTIMRSEAMMSDDFPFFEN